MSGVLGGDQPTTNVPNYTGVLIQTSISTLPIPVGWGIFKVAPNLIWYGDFTKKNAPNSGGGKGGGTTNYDYTASLQFALCEGPVFDVPEAFLTTQDWWVTSRHFTILDGSMTQGAWGYLLSAHPSQAASYPGTVLLCAANYDLGSTPNLPNHNFVVYGPLTYTAWWTNELPAPIGYSVGARAADLALVIQDFLTNPQYGVPGFSSAAIDATTLLSSWTGRIATDASLQTYLAALGMGYCPCVTSQEQAQSVLDRWLQIAFCAAVWSGTALKFIPYADQPISATRTNPYDGQTYTFNFTPNLTPIYDLDDDDFVGDGSADPVLLTRSDPNDADNVLPLEVTTDDGFYSNVPVVARDPGAIQRNSGVPRVGSTVTAHEIVGTGLGGIIAQLLLQRGLYIRNTYQFKLSWEFCLLEPMDLITLTDVNLGLNKTVVRITEVEEDDQGTLTFTAEEFPQGIATATLYQRGSSSFVIPNGGTIAAPVNLPVILEPTSQLVSTPQIWLALSGGVGGVADPNWGGANVWAALASGSWQQIGTVTAPARMGVLTGSLPAVSGWDTTSTLTVDLSESAGQLVPGSSTDADAQAGRTLCWVDGELLGFAHVALALATVSAEADLVPAFGPYQLLVAKGAAWSSTSAVAYAAGGALTATAPLIAVGEAQTVPASVPYQLAVTHQGGFIADVGVSYAAGGSLTPVSGSPAIGQYTVNDGVYGFSAADIGAAVLITYDYAAPGAGQYTVSAATPGVHYFNAGDAGKALLISYSYANPCHYALSRLQRGMYGTVATSHSSGVQFARLDSAVLQLDLPADYVGQTLSLKFVSFNIWGQGLQDISDPAEVTTYTYQPQGAAYDFSQNSFMSILYGGASVALGDLSSGIAGSFACGDLSTAIMQTLQLGTV